MSAVMTMKKDSTEEVHEWLAQAEAARSLDSALTSQAYANSPSFSVIDEFNYWRRKPELAVAVAAIKALTAVIQRSEASTMMGLEIDLKKASEVLKAWDATSISLSAGCNLFLRYVTRTSALEYEDISAGKARLIERGEKFGDISLKARQTIALLGQDFVQDGCRILVHGYSRVVFALLKLAVSNGKHFSVVCTEGRPGNAGVDLANQLETVGIPVSLVLDAAVAYTMDNVDMVLLGAEGVVESGGIINVIGTYQVSLIARNMNKPVYVAAESYKFARLYPVKQGDLLPASRRVNFSGSLPHSVNTENSTRDYTPPQYLTLLFTDLGVLTPSAVSDELIQLYL